MKNINKMPDVKILKDHFIYSPSTGILERLYKGGAIKKTGTLMATGYLVSCLNYRTYYTHRLIWKIVNGTDPIGQIDHINGIKSDNRINNLRDVSESENRRNAPRRSNNSSGFTGVKWHKQARKWEAEIYDENGKYKYLGLYYNKMSAVAARKTAERKYKYHKNHGRI